MVSVKTKKFNYSQPTSTELFDFGDKVFELSSIILCNDKERTHEVTAKTIDVWAINLQKKKTAVGKTKPPKSTPDKILLNRYHLLQQGHFEQLEEFELEQEISKEFKNLLHPWVLALRYVKFGLKETAKKSEHRIIGICEFLRGYNQIGRASCRERV